MGRYVSLKENATYAYVNGRYPRTDKHLAPGSDCSYEIWVNIDCFKDVFL